MRPFRFKSSLIRIVFLKIMFLKKPYLKTKLLSWFICLYSGCQLYSSYQLYASYQQISHLRTEIKLLKQHNTELSEDKQQLITIIDYKNNELLDCSP